MISKEVNAYVNAYCRLRDRQHAVYDECAKRNGLTVNELFVLSILWFTPEGSTQKSISERLSVNKQTVGAVINRFVKQGYITLVEVKEDRRNKQIQFTPYGKTYAEKIISPAAYAENKAMASLDLNKIAELVLLTTEFTENMESQFNAIGEIK